MDATEIEYQLLERIRQISYTLKTNSFLLPYWFLMPLLHQAAAQLAQQ